MRDDYTGVPLDFDDYGEPTDDDIVGLDEWLENDGVDFDEYDDDYGIVNETVIRSGPVTDDARSLKEVAERLYDLADELLSMFDEGWELVDVIENGQGIAIKLNGEDENDE